MLQQRRLSCRGASCSTHAASPNNFMMTDENVSVQQPAAAALGKRARVDDDDEVEFAGRTGTIALADFPHARSNCVTCPFDFADKDKCFETCPNCYCYTCDQPVAA